MQRILLVLAIFTLNSFSGMAERILETVLDPANPQVQHVSYRGRVLIGGNAETFLLSYDDVTFTRFDYPIVSGVPLQFSTHNNPLVRFESAVFIVLHSGPNTHLYSFSGATFTRIPITGNIISNCIVFGGGMYFLTDVSGTTRMYRYSGGVVTELAAAAIPRSEGYKLFVSGSNLYITGSGSRRGSVNFIRRYNGTFLTLPWSGAGTNVVGVFAVPGTSRVYFTSHERILYYNGITVRQVFFNAGEGVHARMFQNRLYFTTGVETGTGRTSHFYRLTGNVLSEVSLPGDYRLAPVGSTNPEVYSDALYIGATRRDGNARVLQFDGTTFTLFFSLPIPIGATGLALFLREGNLMIHPNFVNGNRAFEYDGVEFTEIVAPTDRLLFPYMSSTNCNHLWLNYYSDAAGIHWAYAKESKDCPPPPPAPGPVAIIPEHFRDYERFDMTTYGPERGWCWSEIIIDWEIVPVCPLPPCPEPNYEVRMLDANNGVAWSEKFSKPSSFKVPLPDEQPFKTILSSVDTKQALSESKQDLFVFAPDLVPKGIEIIKVNMKPKQGSIMISAATRKNEPVPLQISLLDAEGKVLWQQTFTAPFSQEITTKVCEPGKTLVFSIPDNQLNFITNSKSPHQRNVARQ